MTVLFEDIQKQHPNLANRAGIAKLDFVEVLYADDTLLLVNKKKCEFASGSNWERIGVLQSKAKPEKRNYIGMNMKSYNIHFTDKTKLEKVTQATYLGGLIQEQPNPIN